MEKKSLIPLEDLIEFLPEHVYWLDRNGIYRGCNEPQAKMMGLRSREEVIGLRNKDLPCLKDHPDIAAMLDKTNEQVMSSGKGIRLEEAAYDANGVYSIYLSHKVPMKDSDNNVIGMLGVSCKIDEIKAEQDRLSVEKENAELALKSIIAHLPGHVYWKDKEGRYLGSNDKQAKSLGFSVEKDLLGKTDFELPWPEGSAAEFRKNDIEVMQTGASKTAEEKAVIDGKEAVVLSQKVPLKNKNDEICGVLGISLDISDLKTAQKNEQIALQKAAADEATKRALLVFSGMSTHDLRTPLSSISLRAAYLNKYVPALVETYKMAVDAGLEVPTILSKVLTELPQVPQDILQGVREANDYIDVSLKSLKGASLGEQWISKDQLVDCNLERLLKRIIDNYPYKAGQENLLHWDRNCDFDFKGNVIFFNRLIENLIKNAFEQIELKAKGEIYIECGRSNGFNILKIRDTAGGVTQDLVDHIFEGIQSTKEGGTGIGLSSTKQIMRSMNGDIDCHLVDGDCIEFRLSFPFLS